uniref:Taste receptor type 2 n=2 Tax=Latimeria chalumnae TaxID=7897 RepID=H2ZX39_LATCH
MKTTKEIMDLIVRMTIMSLGIIGNFLILHVYFLEYRKSKVLQPNELITALLSFFNLLSSAAHVLPALRTLVFCTYFKEPVYKFSDFFSFFFSKLTYWYVAWLCFFYCVKIVKVNWKFVLRLKQRISIVVNILLLGSLILCFALSMPLPYLIKLKANSSVPCRNFYIVGKALFIYGVIIAALTAYFPLLIMVISSLGIVIFLCQHSRNMDKNVAAGGSSHSEAHKAVAIMLICLILLYMTCALTVLLSSVQVSLGLNDIMTAIPYTATLFSTGSSVILIIGTVKLRQSIKRILCSRC